MSKKKLFIFEFIAGGGVNQEEIPSSLFCEGYGMLRAIISDFKALDFEISTLLDYRIVHLSSYLDIDFYEIVEKTDDYIKKYEKLVKESEYCFIIAPEFSKNLYILTKIIKDHEKKLLSIDLNGISLGTSKKTLSVFFSLIGVYTPLTYSTSRYFNYQFVIEKFNHLKTPIIIKPDDGVGAESIYYFEEANQILNFFEKYKEYLDPKRKYILQQYIEGADLSVSLICDGTSTPTILSVNAQNINIKNPNSRSVYYGGHTPVMDFEKIELILNELFSDLRLKGFKDYSGYFGIDIIKTKKDRIYFIEINPRLTTSYIGLRKVININPAKLILESKTGVLKAHNIKKINYSHFTRLELIYTGEKEYNWVSREIISKIMEEIPEIITPPISLVAEKEQRTQYSCFIATCEKTFSRSKVRLKDIKNTFKKYNFELIKLR